MAIIKKMFCVTVALAMVFALAACGGNNTTDETSSVGSIDTSVVTSVDSNVTTSIPSIEDFEGHVSINPTDSLNPENEIGVRYDENYNLLYLPKDVGELKNPIVKGLVSPAPDDEWYAQEYAWKEEAYGLEFDMDTCAWADREAKWVAAYVGGDSYDVLTRVTFPTIVVKGLLEPLDDLLPIEDERYFARDYIWDGLTYGMRAKATNYTYRDCGELYGIWYNQDLFDEYGLESPLELWENGEWTIEKMIELAEDLTVDVDRDGINDIVGYGSWARQLFTIGNGAKTVEFADGKIDLIWNSPAYIKGLEYLIDIAPFSDNSGSHTFANGTLAMYGERIQQARTVSPSSPDCKVNFEAVWVPFPKGANGEGYMGSISTGAETVCIGKGAKNIEGAKVWICADICKFDYVKAENASMMIGVDEATLQRALTCEDKLIVDRFSAIGTLQNEMYKVWDSLVTMGATAAIEAYTPVFQGQIDTVLADTDLD